jgi:hypothetical protein
MKLTKIFSGTAAVVCLLFCASAGNAQTLYGRTEVKYNETTRYMTATSSTEIDFSAMEFYQGYVNIKLTDGGGSTMAVQTLADTDRDGFVEYSNTFAAGPDGSEYTLTGTHRARMSIQDPAWNNRYVDFYYFGYNLDRGSEGGNAWRYVMFFGPGPRKNWSTPWLTIAGTIDANIALEMPQGASDEIRAAWNDLTNDEKKFVIAHPDIATGFLAQANMAVDDTKSRFSDNDRKDGTKGNAFQHALWNALMTQWKGSDLAADFAYAHENYPRNPNDALESTLRNMDLINNDVGRQIGQANPFATRQDLSNLVMNALNSNQLQVVCPPTCRPN